MPTPAHIDSWYAASATIPPLSEPLRGAHRSDVCVVGAGITGLSAAIELAEAGYAVTVLEAERIGWGASGRSGGQAIFGYGCEQAKLATLLGHDDSKRLFDWSLEGLRVIRERCSKYGIDCDWRDGHAHVPIKPRQVDELRRWQDDLATRYDYPLEWWNRDQLQQVLASERYLGALYDRRCGHLHPLKYTLGLARAARSLGVQIHEQSRVIELQHGTPARLRTAEGTLSSDFVVLAGNAYLHVRPSHDRAATSAPRTIAPMLDRRVMPVGTYIAATEPLGAEQARALIANDMAVADVNWALDYFRLSSDHRLLFGGRASYSTLPPPNLRRTMRARIGRVFPQLADVKLDHCWGGYVDISLNRAPHWGRLDPNTYFAQGFSGHGINTTGLAARVIAEAIRGQAERLDVFARIPHAPFPGGLWLRTPLLVAAMAWFKLRDALG